MWALIMCCYTAIYSKVVSNVLASYFLQVCSRCLGIPTELIFISETSSTFVPNASGTGASISTDLYGMAVKVSIIVLLQFATRFSMK